MACLNLLLNSIGFRDMEKALDGRFHTERRVTVLDGCLFSPCRRETFGSVSKTTHYENQLVQTGKQDPKIKTADN